MRGFTLSENTPFIHQQALHFYGKGSAIFDFKAQIAQEHLYQYMQVSFVQVQTSSH